MNDIQINLPENVRLTQLDVISEFSGYDEVMQRTVMLMLTDDSPEMTVNGFSISQLIARSTTGSFQLLKDALRVVSSIIRDKLNEEDTVAANVDIDTVLNDNDIDITIDITKADGTQITETLTV